jgi:hypothetical protein
VRCSLIFWIADSCFPNLSYLPFSTIFQSSLTPNSLCWWNSTVTKCCYWNVGTPALCLGDLFFQSWPEPICSEVFGVIYIISVARTELKLGHGHFLPHLFNSVCINYPITQSYIFWPISSIIKWTKNKLSHSTVK